MFYENSPLAYSHYVKQAIERTFSKFNLGRIFKSLTRQKKFWHKIKLLWGQTDAGKWTTKVKSVLLQYYLTNSW